MDGMDEKRYGCMDGYGCTQTPTLNEAHQQDEARHFIKFVLILSWHPHIKNYRKKAKLKKQ